MKKTGLWSQADLCLKHSPCGHMQDVHTPQSKSWTRSTHTPWARPHPHSPESDCISGSSPGRPMGLEISKHCLHLAEPQYPQLQSGGGYHTSVGTPAAPPSTEEFDPQPHRNSTSQAEGRQRWGFLLRPVIRVTGQRPARERAADSTGAKTRWVWTSNPFSTTFLTIPD